MPDLDLTGGATTQPEGNTQPESNTQPNQPSISFPENWKEALDPDIKEDPSLQAIKDIKNLAKSYVHAQRKMGADKVILPGKHATDEDWQQVFQKLGLPEEPSKYELEGKFINDEYDSKLKETAHKLGILPRQLKGLSEFYNGIEQSQKEALETEYVANQEKEIKALKEEWGDKYEINLQRAQKAVRAFADDDVIQYLKDSGLSGDVKLVKLFSKVADAISEDKFKFESESVLSTDKDSAQKRINEIMGNKEHPYFDSTHPNHEVAVKEVNNYYKIITE